MRRSSLTGGAVSTVTKRKQTYENHAGEASRLARLAATAEERSAYERIASVWQGLADGERDENPGLDVNSPRTDAEVRPQRGPASSR